MGRSGGVDCKTKGCHGVGEGRGVEGGEGINGRVKGDGGARGMDGSKALGIWAAAAEGPHP